MTRAKLVRIEIDVYLTDIDRQEEGMALSTDMEITISKGSEDIPARVALGAAIGGLDAALANSKKQWDTDYDGEVRIEDVVNHGSEWPSGRA
jgi:hypothetical protein